MSRSVKIKLNKNKRKQKDKEPLEAGLAQLVSNVKYKDEHIAALNHDNKPTYLGLAIINKNEEKVL